MPKLQFRFFLDWNSARLPALQLELSFLLVCCSVHSLSEQILRFSRKLSGLSLQLPHLFIFVLVFSLRVKLLSVRGRLCAPVQHNKLPDLRFSDPLRHVRLKHLPLLSGWGECVFILRG